MQEDFHTKSWYYQISFEAKSSTRGITFIEIAIGLKLLKKNQKVDIDRSVQKPNLFLEALRLSKLDRNFPEFQYFFTLENLLWYQK